MRMHRGAHVLSALIVRRRLSRHLE
jgi:hypothetical protein